MNYAVDLCLNKHVKPLANLIYWNNPLSPRSLLSLGKFVSVGLRRLPLTSGFYQISPTFHCSTDDVLLVSNPYVHLDYNLHFTAVVPMVQLQSISSKTSVWNILFTQGLLNRFI